MADNESFPDDISGLWGAPEEDALGPPRPNGTITTGRDPTPAPTNGAHAEVAKDDPRDTVARLADALAGHQVDVVRHSQLSAVRAEMEDAFTQKLAVALYELLSASNDRFASVEDHMAQRLQDMAGRVEETVKAQGDRLALALDLQQRATAELARSVSDELREVSDRFSGPIDALVTFEREVRHEVGRVGDLVEAHNADAARRSEEHAEQAERAGAALSQRLEGSEKRTAAATESLEKINERMASVQSDLSEVNEAIQALREEVSSLRASAGTRRWWGRSG